MSSSQNKSSTKSDNLRTNNFKEKGNDIIYGRLKTCDPIMKDYDKNIVGWIALKTLKTQAKGKKHDVAVKDDMANDVESIKHMKMI